MGSDARASCLFLPLPSPDGDAGRGERGRSRRGGNAPVRGENSIVRGENSGRFPLWGMGFGEGFESRKSISSNAGAEISRFSSGGEMGGKTTPIFSRNGPKLTPRGENA